jgi:RNA polymerase sigma-70 factor (ECF subfamily)
MENSASDPGNPQTIQHEHTLLVQQLFVKHQQALLAYVLSIVPNLPDAQDIVQAVFLVVTRKAATWTNGSNFIAWACSIARYEALHHLRSVRNRGATLDHDVLDLLHSEEVVDERFAEQIDQLADCLKRLSPRASELILLRYHAGQMPEVIASSILWSVNSVRVALTRARVALRECLERTQALEAHQQ